MKTSLYERINEEIDIVSLVSEFVKLEKRGKNYMGLCPFHDEKTPSFSVSPDKKIAMCMSCRMGGRAVKFYSQIKNIPTSEAVFELAQRLGIDTREYDYKKDPNEKYYPLLEEAKDFYEFALHNTKLGEEVLESLYKRGLNNDLVKHFELGLAPDQSDSLYQLLRSKDYTATDMMTLGLINQNKDGSYYDIFRNRIVFPIKNERGYVVGFSGRSINPNEKAKYINSKETPVFKKGNTIYNLSNARLEAVKQKHVILHEGFFDVIASHRSGFEAAVATMGTALTNEQANIIKTITNHVIIAYDGDNAGISATLSAIPILRGAALKISVLPIPSRLDPDDYVNKFGVNKYQDLVNQNLIDSYLFSYQLFVKNKDFKKSDDVLAFKKEFNKIISGADITIINFYENKFKNDYGINLFLTDSSKSLPKKAPVVIKKIVKRAERAVDEIIVNLLINNKYLNAVTDKLDVTLLITEEQKIIFNEIDNYYNTTKHNELDIEMFLSGYVKDKSLYDKYINDVAFKNKLEISNHDFLYERINWVYEYQIDLEIKTFSEESQMETNQKIREEKLNMLLKKQRSLKKVKEEN